MDLALLRASMAEDNVVRLRELFPVQGVVIPDVVELPCWRLFAPQPDQRLGRVQPYEQIKKCPDALVVEGFEAFPNDAIQRRIGGFCCQRRKSSVVIEGVGVVAGYLESAANRVARALLWPMAYGHVYPRLP